MGAAAVLDLASIAVEPGTQVTTQLRVRNTGEVVDQVVFEALGPAAQWASFEPASLSLFPDAEGLTSVRFAPPREPGTPVGTVPFGILVASQEDPDGSVVAEGDLLIARYDQVSAELTPRTARGRTRGRHQLTVDNRGNGPVRARLVGIDPDRHVRFSFQPPDVGIRPGSSAVAAVEVRPRRRFLRGPAVTLPYVVRVDWPDQPVEAAGALLQEALLPRWLPKALLALAALTVAWLVFLRPTVQSAAKVAVEDKVAEASQLAASQAVAPALAKADERLSNVEKAVGISPGAPLPGPTTSTTSAGPFGLGDPFDSRLEASAKDQTPKLTVDRDKVLSVTDILLQNPAGDAGIVAIKRKDQTLLQLRLENFRDLDYHFVSPLVFPAGSEVRLSVTCANPAPNPPPCTPALYLSGFMRTVKP